jgi:hypothetical protein
MRGKRSGTSEAMFLSRLRNCDGLPSPISSNVRSWQAMECLYVGFITTTTQIILDIKWSSTLRLEIESVRAFLEVTRWALFTYYARRTVELHWFNCRNCLETPVGPSGKHNSLFPVECALLSLIIATVETVLLRICVAMGMLWTSRCIVRVRNTCSHT